LAVGVIDAGERIDSMEPTPPASSVEGVVNADFVGLKDFGPRKTSHRVTLGLIERKNQWSLVP
jgi:hypothetical protein